MRVQDVMSKGIEVIAPDAAAADAWEIMRLRGMHHLIVREDGRLVGVFSDRDAGSRRGASLRQGRTVAELMTQGVKTIPAQTPLRRAANVMRGRSIGCLVATEGKRPVGIVTVSDLLDAIGRGADRTPRQVARPTLNHRVPHRKQHGAGKAW